VGASNPATYLDNHRVQSEIVVERDYRLGTIPRFETTFPPLLQGRIPPEAFEHTITTINGLFYDSERLTATQCLESLLGCISLYSYYLCFDARYTKNMKLLSAFLENENATVYRPAGLLVANPLSNGLLYIQILDFKRFVMSKKSNPPLLESSKDV